MQSFLIVRIKLIFYSDFVTVIYMFTPKNPLLTLTYSQFYLEKIMNDRDTNI